MTNQNTEQPPSPTYSKLAAELMLQALERLAIRDKDPQLAKYARRLREEITPNHQNQHQLSLPGIPSYQQWR